MFIEIIDKVDNYEEAIKRSCEVLEKNGMVESRYFDAIKDKIQQYGSYFCIAEGICMPHARPEDGALKDGVCLLKLNSPVDFDGKLINVFFTLSASDKETHLDLVKKIAEVCMNNDKFNAIKKAKSKQEIMEVL